MSEEAAGPRLARYETAWASAIAGQGDDDWPPAGERERVWLASDFVAQMCLREPALLADLHRYGLLARVLRAGELDAALAQMLDDVDDERDLEARLRHFRRRHMLRIIWRDVTDQAPLAETLESLSELADVCVRHALAHLSTWASERFGVPRDADGRAQQLIVLGMGKLGARELNLSSDIDLIFCFPEHGHTDGRKQIENERYFTQLGRQLINVLGKHTVDGFVFRVDMRLRPFGESGPLVSSYDAMENYYQAHARDWERYAMVKARAITGDADDIKELMAMLRAFVFRRYIDFGVIESIRDMKSMIESELQKSGMDADIKLGRGGIREIEFIGQAFQLVRGGREPDLQVRPIQPVLERLAERNILPPFAVVALLDAYRFLRTTENRIQAWKDEQRHDVPSDAEGRARLAVSMGFPDWPALDAALAWHRRRVHAQFSQVFAAPQNEPVKEASPLVAVWGAPRDDAAALAALRESGFDAPDETLAMLSVFRESTVVSVLPARGRTKLRQLMPLLIEAAACTDHAGITLERLIRLVTAIVRRTAYLDLLLENPLALSQLVRLAGESSWVVAQLIRQPLLLDELLDPRRLYSPPSFTALVAELDDLLMAVDEEDLEQEMDRMRQFAQGNRLRVAASDIAGAIPMTVVSDHLTGIAEVTLQRVHASTWRDMQRKYGRPGGDALSDSGFAVIGFGKLGGVELGYGSDLDLVFLHGCDAPNAMTDGHRSIANEVFYARFGQRYVHMLSTRTPSGQLYEVDMRLRPNGNAGHLVASLSAFEKYQLSDAWTWEHQALVRARPVAGDPVVAARFAAIRRAVLCRERAPDRLLDDVRDMRAKMRASLDKGRDGNFDIKHGRGGLVDIEFIAQYGVLRWAHRHPDLTDWTDNARLLRRLADHGMLSREAADCLWQAYSLYRGIVHRQALQEKDSVLAATTVGEHPSIVQAVWDDVIGAYADGAPSAPA